MTKPASTPETLSLHVPYRIAKRGGRKEVQMPPGAPIPRSRVDNTLVKALARAFRWQRMLETGKYATIAELARSERISPPFISRTIRLAHLPPRLVEAILDGFQPSHVNLETLRRTMPNSWAEQMLFLKIYATSEISDYRGISVES